MPDGGMEVLGTGVCYIPNPDIFAVDKAISGM
jgi:hypothetical protein